MSENSLIIREKYISKLFKKIEELEEGLDLLGKVDKRILKKNIQTGGSYLDHLETRSKYLQNGGGVVAAPEDKINLKDIQKAALIAKSKIRDQTANLEKAAANIKKLTENTKELKQDLKNLAGLVSTIKIDVPDLNAPDVNLDSHSNTIVYNLYHCIAWEDLYWVKPDMENDLWTTVLDQKPELANLPRITPEQRNTIKMTKKEYDDLKNDAIMCSNQGGSRPEPGSGSAPGLGPAPGPEPEPEPAPGLGPAPGASFATARSTQARLTPPIPSPKPTTNKYYTASVTSTEIPRNNNNLSETSFF